MPTLMKRSIAVLTRAHPIHVVCAGTITAALLLMLLFGVRLYFPNGHSTLFATEHYVLPLAMALAVACVAKFGWSMRSALRELSHAAGLVASYTIIIFVHFNLKLWSQLINPVQWDDVYQASDKLLQPLILAIGFAHTPWNWLIERWPHAYHDVFIAMFLLALTLHALRSGGTVLTELATAISLVLSIGGVSYAIAPAQGPFIYAPGGNPTASEIQSRMLEFQSSFVASGGSAFDGADFVSALGAMPSLHTAHAFVFFFYAWRHIRWLGITFFPAFAFIATEAITAKWHYVVDLPFGFAIALVSIWLASRMTRRHEALVADLATTHSTAK